MVLFLFNLTEAIYSVLSDNSFLFLLRLLSFFRQLVFMQQFLHFTPIKPETNQVVRKPLLKVVKQSHSSFC